jgi:ketosteroid isomerase-like protein
MPEDNAEIVRRLYAHWEQGDFRTPEFFDDEVESVRTGSGLLGIDGEWRSADALAAETVSYVAALDDLRIVAERITDLGDDRVLVLSRHTAKGKTSGLPYDHELGDLFTLRDGKIVRFVSYWDRAEALEAAGLSE